MAKQEQLIVELSFEKDIKIVQSKKLTKVDESSRMHRPPNIDHNAVLQTLFFLLTIWGEILEMILVQMRLGNL